MSSPRERLIAATSQIAQLGRAGQAARARELFDALPDPDCAARNAAITAHVRCGEPRAALLLFADAHRGAARLDAYSLTAALSACASLPSPHLGAAVQSLSIRAGLCAHLPIGNALIDMYGKCRRPASAAAVFQGMPVRNEVSWCALLHGYVISGLLQTAHKLFEEMPVRSVAVCNALLSGYSLLCNTAACFRLMNYMTALGLQPDAVTLVIAIDACSVAEMFAGMMLHGLAVKKALHRAVEVNNALLSMYAKCGCSGDAAMVFDAMEHRTLISWNAMIDSLVKCGAMEDAALLFRRMPDANQVSWTSLIAGHARNGDTESALELFLEMMRKPCSPDSFTVGAVLHACAASALLATGRMVHGYALNGGFPAYLYVANSLVDMYSKCGDVDAARRVFDAMLAKDIVSWNAMLFGYAFNGRAAEALNVLDFMLLSDAHPDEVTFTGALVACSHGSFIAKGISLFNAMEPVYGVSPTADHIACIADMYRRAEQMLEEDSPRPAALEADRDARYVLLSNMYCGRQRWREAEGVRRAMAEQGLKKTPGCSWVELQGRVSVFFSGLQELEDGARDAVKLLYLEMRNYNTHNYEEEGPERDAAWKMR